MAAKKKVVKHSKVIKRKAHIDGVGRAKTVLRVKPVALLPRYRCPNPKCKHEWIPRTNEPVVCPVCHTPYAKRY